MNEDYLWDKSGENAGIEKLEIALKAFQYQETAAPAIPAKILPFKKEYPRKFFRFAMAAAACLAFGITALGIWSQFFSGKIETNNSLAKVFQPEEKPVSYSSPSKTTNIRPVSNPVDLPVENVEISKANRNQRIVKTRQTFVPVKTVYRTKEPQKIQPENADIKLTKEEQYAYDQLMLALSITSSKLKIVKDKVDGIEETNAVLER